MAARRLRAASPSAQAPTARPIVKTVSSTVVVKKLHATRAMSAARPTSDTRGGRGRQRADREQPRHRQHHLGGEQQDPQSSGQGHRHHQFGVAAPPPQGSALGDGQGDPEKDEGRGIVVLALLQDD